MTGKESFEKMLSNLEPTQRQREAIQKKRENIDSVIKRHPRIHLAESSQPSFLTGSYKRNTLIRPIDDVDLYVVVHYGLHAKNQPPIKVMRLIAAALKTRYSDSTSIRVDTPCIVVKFFSYKFEVVPAVFYSDDPERYMIPKNAREWTDCFPKLPDKWLTSSNQANNGMFVPTIKILKQWNRNNNVGLESFHLELLTERVFNTVTTINDYPQAVFEWMWYVRQWLNENNSPFVPEPVNLYPFVDNYLYSRRPKLFYVRKKLEIGLKRSDRAYNFYLSGKEKRAQGIWHSMFGNMFPSPLPLSSKPALVPPRPAPTLLTSGLNLSQKQNALTLHEAMLKARSQAALGNILAGPQNSGNNLWFNTLVRNRLGTLLTEPSETKPSNYLRTLLEISSKKK